MDNHCTNADDAANCEAAGVAEKHLCREPVPPQVTHQCPYECSKENRDFFRARNVHHVEIFSKHNATAHIGQCHQRYTDDNRVTGTHAIHAIVQVGTDATTNTVSSTKKIQPTRYLFVSPSHENKSA